MAYRGAIYIQKGRPMVHLAIEKLQKIKVLTKYEKVVILLRTFPRQTGRYCRYLENQIDQPTNRKTDMRDYR